MNQDNNQQEPLGPIEYSSSVVESTGEAHYNGSIPAPIVVPKEQTVLATIGLILAFPFPILIIVLWATLSAVKGQAQSFSDVTMNAVLLYLLQFFVVPVVSLISIIIGFIVTSKSRGVARKLGYVSFAVMGVGFVVLGLFLQAS